MGCKNKTLLVFVLIIIFLSACNSAKPSVSDNSEDIMQSETSVIEPESSEMISKLAPTLNNDTFEDFNLTYEQMVKKYGSIIGVDYWEGGHGFLHENGTGMFFYNIDETDIYSIEPIDIPVEPDARFYSAHFDVETLFNDMPDEMTLEQFKKIMNVDDYEIEEIVYEAAYYNGTHMLSFRYGEFDFEIGCDAKGTIKKISRVILTKINATEALWENVSPVKMVNGKPLYINFIEDVPRYKAWNTKVIEAGNDEYGSELLVYSAGTLTDFELFKVTVNIDESIEYYKDEVLLSLDALTPDTVILLTAFLPDVAEANGIAFTDSEGNRHVYAFGDSGRDSSFYLVDEPPIQVDGAKKDPRLRNGDTENETSFQNTFIEEMPQAALAAYASVILDEIPFYSTVYKKDFFFNEFLAEADYDKDDELPMIVEQFAVADLDGNGTPEIVMVLSERNLWFFEVLRYSEGKVYGYRFTNDGITSLKKDGSFRSTAGIDFLDSFGRLRFIGTFHDYDAKAHKEIFEDGSVSFYLHESPINEDMFNTLLNEFMEKEDAEWYEYSKDALTYWLLESPPDFKTPQTLTAEVAYEKQKYMDSLFPLTATRSHVYYDNKKETETLASNYYDNWDIAMNKVYQLLLNELPSADRTALREEQRQWKDIRYQRGEEAFEKIQNSNSGRFAVPCRLYTYGDVTRSRTYRLIDLYFDDHNYD